MMGYGYNMMGGAFGIMIITIIIIAIAVVLVFKLMGNNSKDTGIKDSSLDILNEKFASGEINEEEYNHKKDLILNNKKQ